MATNLKEKKVAKSKNVSDLHFSKKTYVKWYKDMLLIRKFEEKTGSFIYNKNLEDFVIYI